jgi:hypothetical protein
MIDEKKSVQDIVVRRQYEIELPDGEKGYITFTLGRRHADTFVAALALQAEAKAYGLVVLDCAMGPRPPMVWLQTATDFVLCPGEDNSDISEELIRIVGRQGAIFLKDIFQIGRQLPEQDQNGGKESTGRED